MNKPLRLLFVTHNYPPIRGGISTFSQGVAQGLAELGAEVRVLAPVRPDTPARQNPALIPIPEHGTGKLRRAAILVPLLRELRRRPDVIFLGSLHPYGIFVQLLSSLFGVPYALAAHGLELLRILHGQNWLGLETGLAQRTLRGAAAVTTHGQFTAGLARRLAGTDLPLNLIPGAIHVEPFKGVRQHRDRLNHWTGLNLDDSFLLLSVGALRARKGHSQTLKALRLLAPKHPRLYYLIVGEGESRAALQDQTRNLGLEGRVFFLGALPRDDLIYTYQCSDAFIMTSRHLPEGDVEGFGLVYLEANACGLPVIAGNSGGVPDAVRHGETGLLVDPERPELIAAAIESLMNDPDLRRRMGQAGRIWAEEHDWSRLVPRYLEVLESIVRKRP
jgi:phosphatidylinositol alpha-1,6-mannosyltransferase